MGEPRFERDGFVFPIRVLSPKEASRYRGCLEDAEARYGEAVEPYLRSKPHLVFTWVHELVHHPRILDAVEEVLGPNILCRGSSFFIKSPRDGSFVSWHQDSTYWGLEPPDVLTAWVALSDVPESSGAVRFVTASHRLPQIAHRDTVDAANILSRGQVAEIEIDESQVVGALLEAGEMSLHHVRMIHGSGANASDERRIGLAIRYAAAHVRQTKGIDSAMRVRGEDSFGHFQPEPAPRSDMDEAAVAAHAASRSAKQDRY